MHHVYNVGYGQPISEVILRREFRSFKSFSCLDRIGSILIREGHISILQSLTPHLGSANAHSTFRFGNCSPHSSAICDSVTSTAYSFVGNILIINITYDFYTIFYKKLNDDNYCYKKFHFINE